MVKKIIWMALEFATIGPGTFILISTLLDEDYVDAQEAGIGAFLVVTGILIVNWRQTLFAKPYDDGRSKSNISTKAASSIILFTSIFICLFIGLNKKLNANVSSVEEVESSVNEIMDLKEQINLVDDLVERVDQLEHHSHIHRY